MLMIRSFICLFLLSLSSLSLASQGITIYSEEVGVAKFHRIDNSIHAYPSDNVWTPFILANNAQTDRTTFQKNGDGSYTVYFLTLEDLLVASSQISQNEHLPISILNIHSHGLPGATWFPSDAHDLNSLLCYQWRSSAEGSDRDNYDQYYNPVSAYEVQQIRDMGDRTYNQMGCTTGLPEWKTVVARHPEFISALASDVQISFLSCVVGLGRAGEVFTQGLANLLFPAGSQAKIQTSVNFGLGDWSMPKGMGFWDYISDEQINHDDEIYPKTRQDSLIAQKGAVRVTHYSGSSWTSTIVGNQDSLIFNRKANISGPILHENVQAQKANVPGVDYVRVPGTGAVIPVWH